MAEMNSFFQKILADKLAKNRKNIFFNLAYMLGRTASIGRGAAAQIARNSLSADYIPQSKKNIFASESSFKWPLINVKYFLLLKRSCRITEWTTNLWTIIK